MAQYYHLIIELVELPPPNGGGHMCPPPVGGGQLVFILADYFFEKFSSEYYKDIHETDFVSVFALI